MNMEPVVNGLEEKYLAQIEFRALDAISQEGSRAFQAYSLPGHPSYVLINTQAEVLWIGFGEIAAETLQVELDFYLEQR